jgi:KDO2-lipid IV(A) lauroyltransferase
MLFFLAARRRHARLRASWLFMAVLHRAEDLLLAAVWGFFGSLSVERASRLGFRILSKIGPRLRKSRHVRTNLGMARPELSDAELDALVAETWGNYGSALAEYPHLERICVSEADERLEVVGIEHVRPVAEAGEPLLFVPAHLANWEVPAALVHRAGFPLTVVHSPLRNPLVAARMERARQPSGCEFLSKGEGVRAVIERPPWCRRAWPFARAAPWCRCASSGCRVFASASPSTRCCVRMNPSRTARSRPWK